MLMRMLCRMCRCFAEPKPSPKRDTEEQVEAKGQAADKTPADQESPRA